MKPRLFAIILTTFIMGWNHAAVAEEIKHVFVAGRFSGNIDVINVANSQVISMPELEKAMAQFIIKHNDILYLINPGFIEMFDSKSNIKSGEIGYEGFPAPGISRAVITPEGNKMYIGVIGWGIKENSAVYIIDLVARKQSGKILEKNILSGLIALSPDGKYLFCPQLDGIAVVDTKTDKLSNNLKIEKNERIVDLASAGNHLFIASNLQDQTTRAKSQIKSVRLSDLRTGGLKINVNINRIVTGPRGEMYALVEKKILKIDRAALRVLSEYEIESINASLTSDGNILTALSSRDELVLINTNENRIVGNVKFQEEKYGLLAE